MRVAGRRCFVVGTKCGKFPSDASCALAVQGGYDCLLGRKPQGYKNNQMRLLGLITRGIFDLIEGKAVSRVRGGLGKGRGQRTKDA